MKPFKDRGIGLIEVRKTLGLGRLASVASIFYKLNKIRVYIKVFRFNLAPLVCLRFLSD